MSENIGEDIIVKNDVSFRKIAISTILGGITYTASNFIITIVVNILFYILSIIPIINALLHSYLYSANASYIACMVSYFLFIPVVEKLGEDKENIKNSFLAIGAFISILNLLFLIYNFSNNYAIGINIVQLIAGIIILYKGKNYYE